MVRRLFELGLTGRSGLGFTLCPALIGMRTALIMAALVVSLFARTLLGLALALGLYRLFIYRRLGTHARR